MREMKLPAGHVPVKAGKIGVLLMNLGTPDGTDYWSMRRYLKEFLSDRRVIETPRAIWWPILNLIILQTRPQKKGKDYATIWNTEKDESFLKTITRNQAEKLAAHLASVSPDIHVEWAMRYGNPAIKPAVEKLMAEGCDRILAFSLYPQYAAATTATANDHLFRALMQMRWQPTIRIAPPYHDEPAYIAALAQSVRNHLATLDFEPEVIVTSFHGMPKSYLLKGDPYHCQCAKTWRLLREELGYSPERMVMSFQSRFGPDEWLKPYTDETVENLAKRGVKKLAIIAPAFSADCLETLEELDGENRHIFEENGGEKFTYIPCLNDSDLGMTVITDIVERELKGWV
ncbi:ferrochelatase [Phreatobacter oligotrophus]|jgi:ferrochelatase|uniref:Ferrochelatase n=1 Tax=Phreatobacter oligotrophus TaxID=1122261 RepID=A0A2T4YYF9_9HYPH|nr:ferrochelatase [Phreatobacter oligotrophus]PTM51752.1 ferrochelatase [Phreatobacter oligotrophus]